MYIFRNKDGNTVVFDGNITSMVRGNSPVCPFALLNHYCPFSTQTMKQQDTTKEHSYPQYIKIEEHVKTMKPVLITQASLF